MKEPGNAEFDCLRRIAEGYSDMISPCADNILKNLLSSGLIELRPNIWLPLELMRVTYYVTAAGRNYLKQQ